MIDNLFSFDIGAFVTIQGAIMRLRTIGLISTLALVLLAGPLPTEAQQAGKVYRIGFLTVTTNVSHKAFHESLRTLGLTVPPSIYTRAEEVIE